MPFKGFFAFIFGLTFFCAVTYGMYWVFKTVSYEIFYEDMVIETIKEQVKPEYIKGNAFTSPIVGIPNE